jgi:methylenetetrahydrofolate dehydrogenase (NADP+)/methenyltetrahydrofolate cyclohydrolase
LHLQASATQEEVEAAIGGFSDDPAVPALLVQNPIPPHLDYDAAIATMDPDKDVDGNHPLNMGRLALGLPGPVPCTPAGIEALLAYYDIAVSGREVVILGRGVTLGRPLAMLLGQKRPTANAAVTVVHTGVADWPRYTQRADVVVAAAGVPGILQPEHLSPGVVVIGGGVRYEGRRLLPDVDERCAEVASAITPRVGGVGPTTIGMLFRNAVECAERLTGRA